MKLLPSRRRVIKYLWFLLILLFLKACWLYAVYENGSRLLDGTAKDDLLARRRFLVDRVYHGGAAPADMPGALPAQFQGEWALGTYSMFASALASMAFSFPETRGEAVEIIGALIERVLSEEFRRFDWERWGEDPLDSLAGDNGHIGYLGHLNWMLAAFKFSGGDTRYDSLHQHVTTALSRRLLHRPGYCLETYPGEIYVPDNVVVVASIAAYSRLFGRTEDEAVGRWLTRAESSWIDRETGLLPFLLDERCEAVAGVRGSGAGWNSFYLPSVDMRFARHQYQALKEHLVQRRILTGLREYPRGVAGRGDVDSGPVIFGLSTSGTGFAVGGAVHAADRELLSELLFTAELVGSTIQWDGRRHYLLAPLVGEAIMLAMKTARVWDARYVGVAP